MLLSLPINVVKLFLKAKQTLRIFAVFLTPYSASCIINTLLLPEPREDAFTESSSSTAHNRSHSWTWAFPYMGLALIKPTFGRRVGDRSNMVVLRCCPFSYLIRKKWGGLFTEPTLYNNPTFPWLQCVNNEKAWV